MMRLRVPVHEVLRQWMALDGLARAPAATRIVLYTAIGWCCVVVAAVLAGLIGIEFAARSAAPVSAQEARSAKIDRSNANALVQRPVFARTRQAALPVAAQPQALPPPPPPTFAARDSELRLKGVFMNEPMIKAFLISAQNPAGAWVKPQEVFGGWKLVAVRPSEIELEAGAERLIVPLGTASQGNQQKNVVQNFRPSPPFHR